MESKKKKRKEKKKTRRHTAKQQSPYSHAHPAQPHHMLDQAVATSLGLHSQSFFTFGMRKSRSLHAASFGSVCGRGLAPARLEAEAGHLCAGSAAGHSHGYIALASLEAPNGKSASETYAGSHTAVWPAVLASLLKGLDGTMGGGREGEGGLFVHCVVSCYFQLR